MLKTIATARSTHTAGFIGWTKKEFLKFSECITSIYNTKKRTKEQLIALYRYWLRTGVDQKTLASLFSCKTKQQTISDYLNQIRMAIYKDFVSFFLGANKDREFYFKFNVPMLHELHDLKKDDLVVVADGTYC